VTAKRNYTPLDATEHVDPDYLGTGAGGGKFLKDDQTWDTPTGGTGAPDSADYLVGTANGGLSAEIVVGTTPGGELGGTWASPTVDATHSGSSHSGAAAAAVSTHEGLSDPHTGYRLESASILPADLDVSADNTTADATTAHHGLLPKLGGGSSNYLRADGTWAAPSGSGAPASVDYLVGTADAGLSSEIVVGTTPGGELGGTWASPTVDATHSGSAHHTQSHDHSAAGDGTTLTPAHLDTPVEAPGTTEGRIGWDGTLRSLAAYDSVQSKLLTPVGWAPYAMHPAVSTFMEFNIATLSLAAVSGGNGGVLAQWIYVASPMKLDSYQVRQMSTANLRTAEARLYVDRLNNSTSMNFVAGTDATWSFTPSAAGRQTSSTVSGAPVILAPGWYLLVIRNTSTAQTFQIGGTTVATNLVGGNMSAVLTTASTAALGATFDPTGLTKDNRLYAAVAFGRVLGQSTPW
jgi:hypothetical protein